MATDAGTIDYLLDQLGTRGARFTTRRMFGEYCLYREGLPVALVCDDTLFVKDTSVGRQVLTGFAAIEFGPPYPGARPHLRLPPDLWDDGDALRRLLDATASELPVAKPKSKRKSGSDSTASARSPRQPKPEPAVKAKRASRRAPTPRSPDGAAGTSVASRATDAPADEHAPSAAAPAATRRKPTAATARSRKG